MPYDLIAHSCVFSADGTGKFAAKALAGGYANNTAVLDATPFTIEAWVKNAPAAGFGSIFGLMNNGIWIGTSNGFFARSGDSPTSLSLSDGAWHHVAVVCDGTNTTLYADGQRRATGPYGIQAGPFSVGASTDGTQSFFSGGALIDEVMITSGQKYTGTTYTVPAAAFTGAEANRRGLYHMDGDVADAGVGAPALTIGTLTATPGVPGITLSLSAPVAGGSGAGLGYALYRGTTPDFTPNSGSLLSANPTFPYNDNTAVVGQTYYYGVIGHDGAGATVNAIPVNMGSIARNSAKLLYAAAKRLNDNIAMVAIGNSIVYGDTVTNAGSSTQNTAPAIAAIRLRRLGGARKVVVSNKGANATRLADWQPGDTLYNGAKAAMQAFINADAGVTPVFTLRFGANESSTYGGRLTAANYKTQLKAICAALMSDFPTCKIVIHNPTYYTPNTYVNSGAIYEQDGLALQQTYVPAQAAAIAEYASSNPSRVFQGDSRAYDHFAANFATEMTQQFGDNGGHYLHPNDIGAASLGDFEASAIYSAILAGRRFTVVQTA